MDVTDELSPHKVFECSIWVLHFSIYGLYLSSCSLGSHVYIKAVNHEFIWSNKLYNFINMDDRAHVTNRPENTDNIFDKI